MGHFLLGSALLGLAILIVASIHRNNTSGLKRIPNAHFTAPYSRLWLVFLKGRGLENRRRVELHRRLGPVVRVAPREISVNCIEGGIRTTYSGPFDKDDSFYRGFRDKFDVMFTMVGHEDHQHRKRMLSQLYTKSHVVNSQALDDILAKVSDPLREQLSTAASSGTAIDAMHRAKCYAIDLASGWLYGVENAADTLRDSTLQDALSTVIDNTIAGLFWQTNFYWPELLFAKFKSLFSTGSDASAVALHRFITWFEKINSDAHKNHSRKQTSDSSVFDHLWDNFRSANPDMPFQDAASAVAAECDDHLVAAHQGLGITLTYAMYELSRHPDVQRDLRKELLTLAEDSDEKPARRIERLALLDAVAMETMRTRTAGPGPFPRIVPKTGCRLADSFDVPGGTVVSTSAWSLHFNPVPFPSPEQWRPGRWLEADAETLAEMKRWFWAFGNGPRQCIGNNLAMRVVKDFLVTVYTNYETSLEEGFAGNMEQVDDVMAWPVATELKLKVHKVT